MTALSLRSRRSVPDLLRALSGALVLVVVCEVAVRIWAGSLTNTTATVFAGEFVVGVLTTVPFVAGVAYAGGWLERSAVEESRYERVWRWTIAGTAAFFLLNVALMAVLPVASALLAVGWLRWAVAVGAGVGVVVGVTEARAIQQATAAERSAVRAEHLEVQRDLLDYLNSLLRHEVLNASNVISGYAELLRDEHDPGTPGYEYSETIHRKSEEVTRVVQDVRVLLHATEERTDFERVDAAEVVREEAAKLSDLDRGVVVETDLPDAAYVHADALLPRVFGNVLANAVEHNDSDTPHVEIRGRVDDDSVTVEVADDGPGVPDDEVATLFERPSRRAADHGLGLYLVKRLLDHYCGDIELVETGPDGSTFRIVLPREPPVETTGSPFVDPTGDQRTDSAVAGDGR
ncbi:HAMP domain-containing sensor histidine kinase [Halobacterium sp. R2-5]|uniref:sensor histidine kinase n=1 Tax=Halobacterium sp. R2-5 TaxID=2715751 RepID=UPI0014216A4E|nr:HAMP domain-containing sensor histidine kinase [Halobacterium sp. R2-5]NIB99470.1 HAMP domain-containing histidine kinase [Halobacterium sp. R2-5]